MAIDQKELLAKWHSAVLNRDMELLDSILADDVILRTPFYWKPREGRDLVKFLLSNIIEILEGFTYHREWQNDTQWSLEFSATVNGKSVKGVDLMSWGEDGKLKELEVAIRPANGLMEVGEEMGKRIAAAGIEIK